ncbi:MAG: glycosyltransferase family 2 protein [Planctomycetota bacterium]|nr:MAG: glycosyltransferase family 2 protein [Planctomycetota bacterium]
MVAAVRARKAWWARVQESSGTNGNGGDQSVSVITPARDAAVTLEATIRSVAAQTHPVREQIIIDDGSVDGTRDVVQALQDEFSFLRYVKQAKRGAARARNLGIEMAQGRFIAFVDSDDLWLPHRVACQLPAFAHPSVRLVCGGYRVIDEQGGDTGRSTLPPAISNYQQLLRVNSVGCLTAMYDTWRSGKCYMPHIPRRQDYGLWLQLVRDGGVVMGCQAIVAAYRCRAGSLSSNKLAALSWQWHLYRRYERLPLLRAVQCLASHCCAYRRKYRVM